MSEKKYATFRDLKVSPTKTTSPSTPSITSTPSLASRARIPSSTSRTSPAVAPERDFQRVPNSVTRLAIPQGFFRGKSKQVWDYLYSVTRGAIVPVRTVRRSRKEIKAGSGLGSMVTVDAAIEHLIVVGLLAVKPAVGSLIGNEYEVFTPEEASTRTSSTTSTPSISSLTQNLVDLDAPESSATRITQAVDSPATSSEPKTSFKTKEQNTDDEAFAGLNELLRITAMELTGRESTKAEVERWRELGELLTAELKIAAARTGTVSSVPAFLTEHLRRRLWKKDKAQLDKEAASIPEPKQGIDASKCPDCGGSGWWYPEGIERGVAKCRHTKLQ